MKVIFNCCIDGWIPYEGKLTSRPDNISEHHWMNYGPIEINELTWQKMQKNGVISCTYHLTEADELRSCDECVKNGGEIYTVVDSAA